MDIPYPGSEIIGMDKYGLDGQKLFFHVSRVNDWIAGKNIYPVYMEISPTGACNHRCQFCGLDFMEYQARALDTALMKERLTELGALGVKSVMYGGEGEPLIHKDIDILVSSAKTAGIDVSITTNGVLLKPELAEKILGGLTWIKVSVNAGTAETYARIHKTGPADFDKVIENMTAAKKIKVTANHSCVLGMQLVLLPDNKSEVERLAETARHIGMDYLVVKPYSQHPMSKTRTYEGVSYDDCMKLAERLEKYNTADFSVVIRTNSMQKQNSEDKGYSRCLALPFWSYIDSGGGVWGCSVYLSDERFLYGNIYESSFKDIWEGEKRRASLEWVENEMDASGCRLNCRMDPVNHYLWDLTNPPAHVNFI